MLQTSGYAKDVKDPTADELKQFFDKYKETESSPYSPQPGFRVPRKVKIEYLDADPENYESQITEAEITKEYDKDPKKYARDKEDFEKQEKEDRDAREKEDKAAAATKPKRQTPLESKPATEPMLKEPTMPAKSTASPPAGPDLKVPDVKPNAAPAVEKTPEPVKPATTGAKPSGSSLAAPASPFRLVAYADDKTADKTPSAVAEKKEAVAPPTPKAGEQKAVDSKPAATESAKSDAKPDGAKKAGEAKPVDTNSSGAKASKDDAAAKKEERKPIKTAEERLRDLIRKELADKKYRDSIAKVRSTLDAYREKWTNAGDDKPKPPDFAVLAKKYNMTAHRTGLVSERQMLDTDFGKSQVRNAETNRFVPAVDEIFGPTTLYKVDVSFGIATALGKNPVYFFWKTDDEAGGVPKWDDKGVEDKVREEWKLVQARGPAMKAAEDLKKKAMAADNKDKSLRSLAAGDKRIEVVKPRFTWMTSGMLTGQPPSISEVGDLEKPGEDFMKAVFGLSPGQVAVATNSPKSEVYVVRMVSLTPFKELWEQFVSEDTTQEYLYVMREMVRHDVDPAWREKIKRDADFKDLRKKSDKKSPQGQSAPPPDGSDGPPPPEEY